MDAQQRPGARSAKLAPAGLALAALGLVLFAYAVRRAGVAEIIDGITRIGGGFLFILLLSAVREVARTVAWMRCVEGPTPLPFRDAFAARVMGEALGNLTPFGLFLSEPAKAGFVRDRVPLIAALSAITVENIIYSLSAAAVIAGGLAALLMTFPITASLRNMSIGVLVALAMLAGIALWLFRTRTRFLSDTLTQVTRYGLGRWLPPQRIESVRALEDGVQGFHRRNPARVGHVVVAESVFHIAGVAEVYVTLLLIGLHPSLLTAFILEAVNRTITVVFKFVPLRLGVDEAGTGLLTEVLAFGTAPGVTLAIVRKARVLCWTAAGVALLFRRGVSIRATVDQADAARDPH